MRLLTSAADQRVRHVQAHNVKLCDVRTPRGGVQVLRHHTSTVCGIQVSWVCLPSPAACPSSLWSHCFAQIAQSFATSEPQSAAWVSSQGVSIGHTLRLWPDRHHHSHHLETSSATASTWTYECSDCKGCCSGRHLAGSWRPAATTTRWPCAIRAWACARSCTSVMLTRRQCGRWPGHRTDGTCWLPAAGRQTCTSSKPSSGKPAAALDESAHGVNSLSCLAKPERARVWIHCCLRESSSSRAMCAGFGTPSMARQRQRSTLGARCAHCKSAHLSRHELAPQSLYSYSSDVAGTVQTKQCCGK